MRTPLRESGIPSETPDLRPDPRDVRDFAIARRLPRIDACRHSLPVEAALHGVEVEGARVPAADDPSRSHIGVRVQ